MDEQKAAKIEYRKQMQLKQAKKEASEYDYK
jgi:hypothetical protein